STLAAWLLVVIAVPVALTLSGTWPAVVEATEQWLQVEPPLRAIAIVLLSALGLMLVTWKQLVQNLFIGLTGREWVIKSTIYVMLSFCILVGPIANYVYHRREWHAAFWDALPWFAAGMVCVKMVVLTWTVRRLRQRHLLSDRAMVTLGLCWLLIVVG